MKRSRRKNIGRTQLHDALAFSHVSAISVAFAIKTSDRARSCAPQTIINYLTGVLRENVCIICGVGAASSAFQLKTPRFYQSNTQPLEIYIQHNAFRANQASHASDARGGGAHFLLSGGFSCSRNFHPTLNYNLRRTPDQQTLTITIHGFSSHRRETAIKRNRTHASHLIDFLMKAAMRGKEKERKFVGLILNTTQTCVHHIVCRSCRLPEKRLKSHQAAARSNSKERHTKSGVC